MHLWVHLPLRVCELSLVLCLCAISECTSHGEHVSWALLYIFDKLSYMHFVMAPPIASMWVEPCFVSSTKCLSCNFWVHPHCEHVSWALLCINAICECISHCEHVSWALLCIRVQLVSATPSVSVWVEPCLVSVCNLWVHLPLWACEMSLALYLRQNVLHAICECTSHCEHVSWAFLCISAICECIFHCELGSWP